MRFALLLLLSACAGKTPPAQTAAKTSTPASATTSTDDFGLKRETAINVCSPKGEKAYLQKLVCADNSKPIFERRGNVGNRNGQPVSPDNLEMLLDANKPLPEGVADAHIVDMYDVVCRDGSEVQVYLDMYHCADPSPLRSVGPLKLAEPGENLGI
jgi:hypothetical protein